MVDSFFVCCLCVFRLVILLKIGMLVCGTHFIHDSPLINKTVSIFLNQIIMYWQRFYNISTCVNIVLKSMAFIVKLTRVLIRLRNYSVRRR